jgi:RNA polymerase sigma-70 factor (ECF subfamily)
MYGVHRITHGELVLVNGDIGMAIPAMPAEDGLRELDRRVLTFDVQDGQVSRIYDIVNPDKLTHLSL